jgi:hypothetical protein
MISGQGLTAILLAALLSSCGYHVAGRGDLLPQTIKTIAVPAFANNTNRYKLSDRLAQSITREFNSRTRYRVVSDPNAADAILRGAVINMFSAVTTYDSTTGRNAGGEINVALSISLIERATGKTLYSNPGMYVRERYEISTDQTAYFEESDTALERVSRNVGRAIVSAVLEAF